MVDFFSNLGAWLNGPDPAWLIVVLLVKNWAVEDQLSEIRRAANELLYVFILEIFIRRIY